MARSRFAVFGAGRYGTQIALSLARRGAEVFTFDANADRAELLKEDVSLAVTLDSTDKKALLAQHVQDLDAAVVGDGRLPARRLVALGDDGRAVLDERLVEVLHGDAQVRDVDGRRRAAQRMGVACGVLRRCERRRDAEQQRCEQASRHRTLKKLRP